MRTDQFLLTLHIVAVAAWIGAGLTVQVLAARLKSSTPVELVDHFAHDAEALGKAVFAPASITLLVTGVALVAHEHVSWSSAWIVLGIVAFLATGAVGGSFLIPEGRKIAALASQPGHDPLEVLTRSRRRVAVARVGLLILILGVADMVFRPGA